jgi:lysophospholipase-2
MQMPAWFDLYGLSPNGPEDVEGIKLATQYVHSLIQKEIDDGIEPSKIVVGGFSMGGALALHAALTLPVQLGAVVGLSSFLLQRDAVAGVSFSDQITINDTFLAMYRQQDSASFFGSRKQ